ncbi:MAG: tRNA 2-thiouridine(34) synthase MnmA [Bdellovibrionota bacterium]
MNLARTSTGSKGRVLVAMSGGVDSSVVAALLKEQGYEVIGVTMQVWDYSSSNTSAENCAIEEGNGTCCSSIDVDDARAVADQLDIPFYVINCEAKFKKTVIDSFVNDYLNGKTPIPCVNCNTYLKFDHLIQKMKELNCDYLATGHYAQLVSDSNGEPTIVTSSDDWKDQTYFLFTLDKSILPKLMFPIGSWQKPELRKYAEEKGLRVARKKDSTGICFIGPKGHAAFIEERIEKDQLRPGSIRLYPSGEVLGEHDGIHRFTIGQRKGLGVATGTPAYVIQIDHETGTVWLGDEQYLFSRCLQVTDMNWLNGARHGEKLRVKIRYAHQGSSATVLFNDLTDAEKAAGRTTPTSAILEFDEPQRSVTPGQAAVFYREKQLVGGGWIVEKLDGLKIMDMAAPVVKPVKAAKSNKTAAQENRV